MNEQVILVDENDNALGTMEKMEAHRKGLLHRAFSVILHNDKGELLLQKRADSKYHSAGLWTNTCCSHPRPGEKTNHAVARRLKEEMGITVKAEFAYSFVYKTILEDGLIEHEYDHVYVGICNDKPEMNIHEVQDWKYISLETLKQDVVQHPDHYTHWFKLILSHPELKIPVTT